MGTTPQRSLLQVLDAPAWFPPDDVAARAAQGLPPLDLHRAILAAFGFEGEYGFRFSRWLSDYSGAGGRFQRLPPEMWISQLAPLNGSELVLRHRFGDVNDWRFTLVYGGM
jgi:hypothetical protein